MSTASYHGGIFLHWGSLLSDDFNCVKLTYNYPAEERRLKFSQVPAFPLRLPDVTWLNLSYLTELLCLSVFVSLCVCVLHACEYMCKYMHVVLHIWRPEKDIGVFLYYSPAILYWDKNCRWTGSLYFGPGWGQWTFKTCLCRHGSLCLIFYVGPGEPHPSLQVFRASILTHWAFLLGFTYLILLNITFVTSKVTWLIASTSQSM